MYGWVGSMVTYGQGHVHTRSGHCPAPAPNRLSPGETSELRGGGGGPRRRDPFNQAERRGADADARPRRPHRATTADAHGTRGRCRTVQDPGITSPLGLAATLAPG